MSEQFVNIFKCSALIALSAYRTLLTTHLGGCCCYIPSCSEYAVEAVRTHSPLNAISLIFRRLLRCHPGCTGGYDPVPMKQGGCKHA